MPTLTPAALFPSNPATEDDLNRQNLKFRKEPTLLLAQMEVVEEIQVRGITDRADPHTINRYAEMMRAGVTLPPIIAAEVRVDGRTVIAGVDFNHRKGAAEKVGRTTLPAYVIVGAAPVVLKALALKNNRAAGKLLSDAETQVAIGDLADAGLSVERIVQISGLKRSTVDRAINAHKFDQRLQKAGLPQSEEQRRQLEALGVTARAKLARIGFDNVFAETTRLVLDAGMKGEDVNSLVKAVTQVRTSAGDQMKLLGDERIARQPQITRVNQGFVNPNPSYQQQFAMHAKALLKLVPCDVVDYNPSTREDAQQTAKLLFDFAYAVTQCYDKADFNADPPDDGLTEADFTVEDTQVFSDEADEADDDDE